MYYKICKSGEAIDCFSDIRPCRYDLRSRCILNCNLFDDPMGVLSERRDTYYHVDGWAEFPFECQTVTLHNISESEYRELCRRFDNEGVDDAKIEEVKAELKTEIKKTTDATAVAFVTLAESGTIPKDKAAEHPEMFDTWTPDTDYESGKITSDPTYKDGSYLFQCRQLHTSQTIYPPHTVSALWEAIPKPGEGSRDNPIPYDASVGMALENGKYYTEYGVLYICTRDTGTAVYNPLSALVGIYVDVAE